ncbi:MULTISPECIES: hypothetical protein [unclassified Methylobacterium]|uniref:hypothetical protein n=1 Tax=unclassified Methylobacterium TaxID=2615210 RepID=UPI00226A4703|nr:MULTISPECIES: hypothetical protein [unclassified Methylobacterium]
MSFEPIGAVIFLLGMAMLFVGEKAALGIFLPCVLLQSAAAMLLPGVGVVQPGHFALGFVILVAMKSQRSRDAIFDRTKFGKLEILLVCTLIYGLLSAFFLPRLFQYAITVNAIGGGSVLFGTERVQLEPTSGNITQPIYFIGDIICYFVVRGLCRSDAAFWLGVRAVMLTCVLNCAFGLLDIATKATGTTFLLGIIRNSTYGLLTEVSSGSFFRIVGSYTEASAFAGATLSTFTVSCRLWLGNVYPRINLPIAMLSLLLLLFSTSSTGYAGLPVCFALLYFGALYRITCGKSSYMDAYFVSAVPLTIFIIICFIIYDHDLFQQLSFFFDQALFSKGSSESGIERGTWNADALQSFYSSYGLGIGLGSTRASSFLLACLSNIGALGSMFFGLFILGIVIGGLSAETTATAHCRAALRLGCLGTIIAASISGTLVDLGLWFYTLAALATTNDISRVPAIARDKFIARWSPAVGGRR